VAKSILPSSGIEIHYMNIMYAAKNKTRTLSPAGMPGTFKAVIFIDIWLEMRA
jgi:hypothetical protein